MSEFINEIENCIPALRRYAFALSRDLDASDDLVQDCLERALRKRILWRRGSSMRAWLFTILHNLYVNQLRTQSRRPRTQSMLSDPASQQESSYSDAYISEIEACLQQLPEEQRQVLLLVSLEGFSYKEVSKILNIPMGTVMSRLSRSRECLRKLMDGDKGPVLRRVK